MVFRPLEPPVLTLLYAVHLVDLTQQRCVHAGLGELHLEVLASVRQRHRGLSSQNRRVDDPLDLMLLEKSISVILSRYFTLCVPEPLADRLVFLLDLCESVHVQLSDPRGGDLEELPYGPVGGVGPVVIRLHHLPELQFNDVVYLLFREFLHL